MESLVKTRTQLKCNLNKLRAMERYIHLRSFENFYKDVTAEEKIKIIELIKACDVKGLREEYRRILKTERSVRDLQIIARQLQILNYSRMSKEELLEAINDSDGFRKDQENLARELDTDQQAIKSQAGGLHKLFREA